MNTANTAAVSVAATYRSLYEVTGDVKDINTMLVPRAALAAPAQAAPVDAAVLMKARTALGSCTSGSYRDVDGDFCRSYRFDRGAVKSAIEAIDAARAAHSGPPPSLDAAVK